MLSSFTYNGHSSEEFGIRIEKKPVLNRSARKFQSASVPGRNGNIYQLEDAWSEVIQPYEIFAGEKEEGAAVPSFTAIMEWLNSAAGYTKLQDTYDPDHYRMAVFVDSTNIASTWHDFGRATINFRCRPEHYIAQDPLEVENGDIITNETNHVAHPLITLTGEGAHSLLDMEKPSPDHNESGMPYYFWELLPCFGAVLTGMSGSQRYVSMFTDEYAEIDKLRIVGRQNSTGHVSFTAMDPDYGVGTAIEVNPNTDYTISASTNRPCTVQVLFFTSVVGLITSEAHASNNGGDLQLTFRTPADCSKILIAFFTVNSTTITVSSIMVNKGTEALPFRAFAADTSETITINETTLKILLNGFGEAVIDCERENFSVDGVDNNIGVSILDQYGNLSVDYLKLDKGENEVSFSEGISTVTIDPRYWEL